MKKKERKISRHSYIRAPISPHKKTFTEMISIVPKKAIFKAQIKSHTSPLHKDHPP
jgi:hypothetical protein